MWRGSVWSQIVKEPHIAHRGLGEGGNREEEAEEKSHG
jgi:hypothetical protein